MVLSFVLQAQKNLAMLHLPTYSNVSALKVVLQQEGRQSSTCSNDTAATAFLHHHEVFVMLFIDLEGALGAFKAEEQGFKNASQKLVPSCNQPPLCMHSSTIPYS